MDTDASTILLLGEGDLAEEVRAALDALDADVVRLVSPSQREVAAVFERSDIDRAVVVAGTDAVALRGALMVRHADPDVELLVTYSDPGTAAQLSERIGNCRTLSTAEIVAPTLAGPCLDADLGAVRVEDGRPVGMCVGGANGIDESPVEVRGRRRLHSFVAAVFRPYDRSAALLLYGALGLLAVLVTETVLAVIVVDQAVVDAFYGAAKTLVTVDPNDEVSKGPAWFKTTVSILMLVALVFEAFFTAGIVNRMIDRRLTGLAGRRAVPRRDHVIVVGLGPVGLRLCLLLRECGAAVVAVDSREDAEAVGQAREAGLPVVVGRGADPSLLRRLRVDRALSLAATTDDDLENLAVALAARSVNEDLRVVLRVGDGRLANETRSLFEVGVVRDVHRIAAGLIAAQATGSPAGRVICAEDRAHLLHDDGRVEEAAIAAAT